MIVANLPRLVAGILAFSLFVASSFAINFPTKNGEYTMPYRTPNRVSLFLAAILTFATLHAETFAQIHIVSPSEARESGGDLGFDLQPGSGGYVKAYSLYPASDFDALPEGGAWVVGYGDRADNRQRAAATYTSTDLRLSMSTVSIASLSNRLANNIGDDATVVLDVASSAGTYIPSGELPHEFSTGPLNTPFFYNPADGNLVVEFIERRSHLDAPLIIDYQSVPYVGDAVAFNPNRQNANFVERAALVAELVFLPELLNGDMDFDGDLDVEDLDALTNAHHTGTPGSKFDVNQDGTFDDQDPIFWVHQIANTYFGDANLDGEFNSGDLVKVSQAGKYEVDVDAGWADGDWTGDQRFDTADLITAFRDGGYELGPRNIAARVPEPTSLGGLLIGLLSVFCVHVRRLGCECRAS